MTTPNISASTTIAEYTDTVGVQTYRLLGALAGCWRFRDTFDDGVSLDYIVTDGPNVEVTIGTLIYGAT